MKLAKKQQQLTTFKEDYEWVRTNVCVMCYVVIKFVLIFTVNMN